MAHRDRAHADAVDHLGDAAELAGRIDLHRHFVVGRAGDAFRRLRGVDGLDVAFGADMGVAQLGSDRRGAGQREGESRAGQRRETLSCVAS